MPLPEMVLGVLKSPCRMACRWWRMVRPRSWQSREPRPNPSTSTLLTEDSTRQVAMTRAPQLTGMCSNNVEKQMEQSEPDWSQLAGSNAVQEDEEVAEVSNVQEFKVLQTNPDWGSFVITFGDGGKYDLGELVVGEKFAEGGQAEIFEAQVSWANPKQSMEVREKEIEYVLKVFKKGTKLRHLRSQFSQGMLEYCARRYKIHKLGIGKPEERYHSVVSHGTLLRDGRFAFLMHKEHIDLGRLIEYNMEMNDTFSGPFSKEEGEWIMYRLALGMQFLHSNSTLHRGLKSSNVLISKLKDGQDMLLPFVADFECAGGVVGTGFFRAPEILQACKDKNLSKRLEVFSKAADVYSYGMTCIEILTGKRPFHGYPVNDYDLVLEGQRPKIPNYVDDWIRELISRCLKANPADRPTFQDILKVFSASSAVVRKVKKVQH